MLRGFVLLMLLLNAGYFVWAHGYLSAYDVGPQELSEPQHVAQQIRPNDIHIVGVDMSVQAAPAAAPTASATAESTEKAGVALITPAQEAIKNEAPKNDTPPPQCLQAGPFDIPQAQALARTLAATLPANSWRLEPTTLPARWIIYMGKYESADAVVRKKAELRSLSLLNEPLRNPAMEPGLSLGGFDSQAAANNGLAKLAQRGVRTARVVQELVERPGQLLRVPEADESLRGLLEGVKGGLVGRKLAPCGTADAAG